MIIYLEYFFSGRKYILKEVCATRPIPDNWMMEGVRGAPLVVQNGQGSSVQFKSRPVGALLPLRSLLTISLPKGGWESSSSIFYLFSSLESSLPPEPIMDYLRHSLVGLVDVSSTTPPALHRQHPAARNSAWEKTDRTDFITNTI